MVMTSHVHPTDVRGRGGPVPDPAVIIRSTGEVAVIQRSSAPSAGRTSGRTIIIHPSGSRSVLSAPSNDLGEVIGRGDVTNSRYGDVTVRSSNRKEDSRTTSGGNQPEEGGAPAVNTTTAPTSSMRSSGRSQLPRSRAAAYMPSMLAPASVFDNGATTHNSPTDKVGLVRDPSILLLFPVLPVTMDVWQTALLHAVHLLLVCVPMS